MPLRHLVSAVLIALLLMLFSTPSQAENRLDQMIVPIANPATAEDPRPMSEVRAIFMWHEIGDGFFTAGGDQRVYGLQFRMALDDRLTFVVNRASYYDIDPARFAEGGSGLSDLEIGLKYSFLVNKQRGVAAAWGLGWQIPVGESEVFQGRGDGFVHPYVAGAMALENYNVSGSTGFRLPFSSADSGFWDVNLHVDAPMGDFYPLMELNFVQSIDDGNRLGIDSEGADLVNFGADNASGEPLLTSTVGARYRLGPGLDWGLGYQVPLTDGAGADYLDWRITSDLSFTLPNY